ncbi:MAG: hypothetical protein WCL08_04275 [Verrucomicrobiota bacterium]
MEITNEITNAHACLSKALYSAHYEAAYRENASTLAVQISAESTQDFVKACMAALATIGKNHAPIVEIYEFLMTGKKTGDKIPGWGSSFHKGKNDPHFIPVRFLLESINKELFNRINEITAELHLAGKNIYPNPGCWTAAAAITFGMPKEISPILFLRPRMDAWAIIFSQTINTKTPND